MRLTLWIEGQRVLFYSAELNYSVEQLAHTFRCDIRPMTINTPLSIEFQLDGNVIFQGAIDKVSSSTASDSRTMSIAGRSRAANMVDFAHYDGCPIQSTT